MLSAVVSPGNAQINPNDYSYPVVTQSEYYLFHLVTVVDGLKHPWSLTFLPNGDMLIAERQGRLRIVRNGVIDPEPIPGIPPVWYTGNAGLLDVAVHPDYESNGLIYFTYAKPSPDGSQGTLTAARGRFDGRRLTDVEDIFVANAWGERPFHLGSRIAIDNTGYVYISTGDRQLVSPDTLPLEENPAQDLSSHAGSIMRVHEDGRIPADNPFVDTPGAQPEIWSYGHRNVQGLEFDRESGELWAIEHGPTGGDELNLIRKGRNYGWPVIHYGTGRLKNNVRVKEGMEQPVEFWTPSVAPAGLMIYYGDKFPKWQGHIFVSALRHHNLHRLERTQLPDGSYTIGTAEDPPMLPGIGRIRDLVEGPDGYIYLVMDDHRTRGRTTPILRMEPVEELEFNPHYHPALYGTEGGTRGRD
jgi:glucose/arabinose dehydrogenase